MKSNRTFVIGLAIIALTSMISSTPGEKKPLEPVKVFIFTSTNDSGFTDSEQKQRVDSVSDLKKMLGKDKRIEMVEKMEVADVILVVVGRGDQEVGSSTKTTGTYTGWNTTTNSITEAVVNVGLQAGDYKLAISGHSPSTQELGGFVGRWTAAARDAADQIEKWIKVNQTKLIAARAGNDNGK